MEAVLPGLSVECHLVAGSAHGIVLPVRPVCHDETYSVNQDGIVYQFGWVGIGTCAGGIASLPVVAHEVDVGREGCRRTQ